MMKLNFLLPLLLEEQLPHLYSLSFLLSKFLYLLGLLLLYLLLFLEMMCHHLFIKIAFSLRLDYGKCFLLGFLDLFLALHVLGLQLRNPDL